jgi:hypothetical protein
VILNASGCLDALSAPDTVRALDALVTTTGPVLNGHVGRLSPVMAGTDTV